MLLLKIIFFLILTSNGAVSTEPDVPSELLCCPRETGTFQTDSADPKYNYCLDDKTNKTTPLPIKCNSVFIELDGTFNYNITDTGQVVIKFPNRAAIELERGKVCFAYKTGIEEDWSNKTSKGIVTCLDEEEEHNSVLEFCMIVSVIFLTLTAVVYSALPEVRDLQGKSIINFCGSLAIGLAILSYMRLTSYSDMTFCSIRGFLTYFFVIAAFFWTNAISLQILLSMKRPVVNNYGWKEFFWYALYAWGFSATLTACVAVVNFHPGDHPKPGIGLNTCWFYSTTEQWHYMYSVMTILIFCNICIFIYTSIHLWRLSFSSSHVKALKYKSVMSLRMFIIMGLPWLFEMISTLTEKSIVWVILDIFNMLQGPLIFFLLVVFRKRVLKALLKRGCLDCVAGPIERYLALREDDEEGVMQQTVELSMNEGNGI